MTLKQTNDQFVRSLMGAPQDVSLPILEDLLSKGYDLATWNTSASATDGPCISKNGDQMALSEFIAGLVHAAPFYEKTHVGCTCSATVTGPDLPEIIVNAFGIVEGEPPVEEIPEEVVPEQELPPENPPAAEPNAEEQKTPEATEVEKA
jgi:hypothetical protein